MNSKICIILFLLIFSASAMVYYNNTVAFESSLVLAQNREYIAVNADKKEQAATQSQAELEREKETSSKPQKTVVAVTTKRKETLNSTVLNNSSSSSTDVVKEQEMQESSVNKSPEAVKSSTEEKNIDSSSEENIMTERDIKKHLEEEQKKREKILAEEQEIQEQKRKDEQKALAEEVARQKELNAEKKNLAKASAEAVNESVETAKTESSVDVATVAEKEIQADFLIDEKSINANAEHIWSGISIAQKDNETVINIQSKDSTFPYKVFILPSPERLVIDLSGKWKGVNLPKEVNDPLIKNIRVGIHPNDIRLVFDLSGKIQFVSKRRPTKDSVEVVIKK